MIDDAHDQLKALFILPNCVTPPDSGPAHLTAGLLRAAVNHMRCEVVGFSAGEGERERWSRFEEEVPGVALLRVFDRARGRRRYAGRILRALRDLPVSTATFDSPALHRWLSAEARMQRWDLIHFDTFNVAGYRKDVAGVPTVLVPPDAYSMGARQGSKAATRLRDVTAFLLKAQTYRRFEAREYRHFDVVAPVAQPDAIWLSRVDPRMKLAVIQFPIGSEYVPPIQASPNPSPRIALQGFFRNPAVSAGLEEFLKQVYPMIRERLPSVPFTVWGRLEAGSPVRRLLERLPEITRVDYVDDYLTFLRSFDIFIYPQRYGAGVQVKVQQAMAVGAPVVTRPHVLAGLRAEHGIHAFGHEDNVEFADTVVRLARNATLRQSVGRQASALIHQSSSPENVWISLSSLYRLALDPGDKQAPS